MSVEDRSLSEVLQDILRNLYDIVRSKSASLKQKFVRRRERRNTQHY